MKTITLIAASIFVLSTISCDDSSKKTDTKKETETELIATTSEVTPTPSKTYLYVNAASGLSLRSGTNLTSKKILTLPYGSQVEHLSSPVHTDMTVDGIEGKMIEVSYQGATGFVFDGYTTILAPPQEDESPENYAKRISTPENTIEVVKKADKKGEAYGMLTQIEIPATSFQESYKVAKALFDLPKKINPGFTKTKSSITIVNQDKRERTLTDQLFIEVNDKLKIDSMTYLYELKDYKRTVSIIPSPKGYTITENQSSL